MSSSWSTADLVSLFVAIASAVGAGVAASFTWWSNVQLAKLQDQLTTYQRRRVHVEDMQELMQQYKKPLVQSAFDLQSRLKEQLTRSVLSVFQGQEDRRKQYMRYSTVFLVCEFLGWLEVIRQEIVFVAGKRAETLNQIIDAIKFQFSGEDNKHGVHISEERKGNTENKPWSIFLLLGVELRAIGEVMLDVRSYDDDKQIASTGQRVIGFAEFQRRCEVKEPNHADFEDKQKYVEAKAIWESCTEKKFKKAIAPLEVSVERLMKWPLPFYWHPPYAAPPDIDDPPPPAPKERVAMLQVLLCKLIDFLDDPEPTGTGHPSAEERFLSRDHRLAPMVAKLSPAQLNWLAKQPFMKDSCKDLVDPEVRHIWRQMVDSKKIREKDLETWKDLHDGVFEHLSFPGLMEHAAKVSWLKHCKKSPEEAAEGIQQDLKDEAGIDVYFPGAFPPRAPQKRTWPSWFYRSKERAARQPAGQGPAGRGYGSSDEHPPIGGSPASQPPPPPAASTESRVSTLAQLRPPPPAASTESRGSTLAQLRPPPPAASTERSGSTAAQQRPLPPAASTESSGSTGGPSAQQRPPPPAASTERSGSTAAGMAEKQTEGSHIITVNAASLINADDETAGGSANSAVLGEQQGNVATPDVRQRENEPEITGDKTTQLLSASSTDSAVVGEQERYRRNPRQVEQLKEH